MSVLTRTHRLFLAIELREASTTTGLYQQQTGKMLPIDPQIEFTPARSQRNINQRSLTQKSSLSGVRIGTARYGLEMVGGTFPAQFGNSLRCCSFVDEPLGRFTIGAVSGTFRHGERVDQASSGAWGTIVSDVWDGDAVLWVAQDFQLGAGVFDGTGQLVGASSGATATPSAFVDDGGSAWWPYSYRTSRMLFDATGLLVPVTAGDVLKGMSSDAVATVFASQIAGANAEVMIQRQHNHFTGSEVVRNQTTGQANIGTLAANGFEVAIRGTTASIGVVKDQIREEIEWARGNVTLEGTIGEPLIFGFDFLGKDRGTDDRGDSVQPDFTGMAVPPLFLGADLKIGYANDPNSALKSKCIRSFNLDMGHEVAIQDCAALNADHGPFFVETPLGVDMAMIVGRSPTLSLDPYLAPDADFPWMEAWRENRPLRMKLTVGSEARNKFTISIPSMIPSQIDTGDFDGISVRNVTLALDGGNAPGPRGDNEVVIVQDYFA